MRRSGARAMQFSLAFNAVPTPAELDRWADNTEDLK